ncbi:MAG: tetratricopeptide repeat protein [bacterium]|nr:tetratricopeptide repeat protein [bacterium]
MAVSNAAFAKDKSAPDTKVSEDQQAEDKALMQAMLHIAQRQFDAALTLIEPIVAIHDAQAATEKRQIFSARTFPEMMEYMLGSVAQGQGSVVMPYSWAMAPFLKGFALIDMQRGEEAKLWLDRAVALSPSNAKFLGELGEWYKARGRLDEATTIFKRAEIAAHFTPDDLQSLEKGRAMRGIAWVAVEQGRLDEAETIYRQCLTMNAQDQMAKNELAYIAEQKSKAIR